MPAFFKTFEVPPVEIISKPSLESPAAKSIIPLLSETLIRALGRIYHLSSIEKEGYKFFLESAFETLFYNLSLLSPHGRPDNQGWEGAHR